MMNGIKLTNFEKLYHLADVLYKNYNNHIYLLILVQCS